MATCPITKTDKPELSKESRDPAWLTIELLRRFVRNKKESPDLTAIIWGILRESGIKEGLRNALKIILKYFSLALDCNGKG